MSRDPAGTRPSAGVFGAPVWHRPSELTADVVDVVEVAPVLVAVDDRTVVGAVLVRSSEDGATAAFSPDAWRDFTAAVRRGELDVTDRP